MGFLCFVYCFGIHYLMPLRERERERKREREIDREKEREKEKERELDALLKLSS